MEIDYHNTLLPARSILFDEQKIYIFVYLVSTKINFISEIYAKPDILETENHAIASIF